MAKSRKSSRDTRLERTAAGLGKALGQMAARVDALQHQRQAVVDEIRQIIGAAEEMLADLGDAGVIARRRLRRRVRKARGTGVRRLSPEGRARIIAAAKRRWAKARRTRR
jgi:hypothetical protein